MIVELKINDPPEKAIIQMREKRYIDKFYHYEDNAILVAITFNEKDETKKHHCLIEKY